MALTLAEIAERIVCTACTVATDKVNVVSFEPFVVRPRNLFNKTFAEIAIDSDQTMSILKSAAAELIPIGQSGRDEAQNEILAQDIAPGKKIQLFADFIEAVLAEHEAADR